MKKQRIYVLIGLPGSGKSSWSLKQLEETNPRGCVIVSRDSIRCMLNGSYKYLDDQQSLITSIAASAVKSALNEGKDIIIDQANISKKSRKEVTDFVVDQVEDRESIDIHFIHFCTDDIEMLVSRRMVGDARKQNDIYHRAVIEKMKNRFEHVDTELEDFDVFYQVAYEGTVLPKLFKNRDESKVDKFNEIPLKELWSLDRTLAEYIYPRLKAFKEMPCSYPGYLNYKNGKQRFNPKGPDKYNIRTEKLWQKILDKMILSFELRISSDDWDCEINSKEYKKRWSKIDEGLNLFAKHFNALWF